MSEAQSLKVYIGRANEDRFQLLQDGEAVTPGAVSRVVLRLSKSTTEICIDTDEDADPIEVSNEGVVSMQLGLVEGLAAGIWRGQLRVYDNEDEEGIMWQLFVVEVFTSPDCETETT